MRNERFERYFKNEQRLYSLLNTIEIIDKLKERESSLPKHNQFIILCIRHHFSMNMQHMKSLKLIQFQTRVTYAVIPASIILSPAGIGDEVIEPLDMD